MIAARQPTPVLYVACADELEEIRAAWDRLEAVVPLKGRRFYGAAHGDGTYWACVERLAGEERDRILPAFEALAGRAERDPSRPEIEHYRRRDEIDVLLPVP